MSDDKIVPFGKYKGKPVEVMLSDRDYVQWLMAQDWFRQKPLYQLVINYGAEPQETPEHNALQVLFLDNDFCQKFVRLTMPLPTDEALARHLAENFELNGASVSDWNWEINDVTFEQGRPPVDVCLRANLSAAFSSDVASKIYWPRPIVRHLHWSQTDFRIELKTSIGDDYPAVLRQMRAAKSQYTSSVLVLKEYVGAGATLAQFIALFKASGISVVFLHEIA